MPQRPKFVFFGLLSPSSFRFIFWSRRLILSSSSEKHCRETTFSVSIVFNILHRKSDKSTVTLWIRMVNPWFRKVNPWFRKVNPWNRKSATSQGFPLQLPSYNWYYCILSYWNITFYIDIILTSYFHSFNVIFLYFIQCLYLTCIIMLLLQVAISSFLRYKTIYNVTYIRLYM